VAARTSTAPTERIAAEDSSGHDGLAAEALRRLRRSGYSALAMVSCEREGSTLRLHGCVRSYYLKQLSQEIVAGISEVGRIINLIAVADARRGPEPVRDVSP
jgi:hypothetical protein